MPPQVKSLAQLVAADLPTNATWAGPSYLPKGGTLLLGAGAKVGKSFCILENIRDFALGNPIYGHPDFLPEAKPRILYFEQELGEWGLQKRLKRLLRGLTPEQLEGFTYVSKIPEFKLDTYEGYKLLLQLMGEAQPDIVILDPVGRMLEGDDSSNQVVRQFYAHLDEALLKHPGASAIIAHHFRKPGTDETSRNADTLDIHNFRGASQWVGNPDTLVSASKRHHSSHCSWYLEMRVQTRQGESPEDFYLEVNAYNLSRVLYVQNSYKAPLYDLCESFPFDI
jgi:RecA-family ATPase